MKDGLSTQENGNYIHGTCVTFYCSVNRTVE